MQGVKVFSYDPRTGSFVKEYPSKTQAETELNCYKGAIHEYIRGLRKKDVGGFIWSSEKKDNILNGSEPHKERPKIGMTLNEFREKHDVDYIVNNTLRGLRRDMIYEKNDVCKLTGLRPGYPGLSQTIDSAKEYYGKVGSTLYFSHPDTIQELKEQAKLM